MEACRRDVLKKSLSKILTRYYPLSRRIKEDSFIIDCNDDGVDYLETRLHNNCRPVSEFIQHPNVHLLKQFLPFNPYSSESSSEFSFESGFNSKVFLVVQVSLFDCGGMAIGVCISHKIADASSLTTFINDWCHGTGPRFDDLRSLFPPRDIMGYETESKIKREEIVTKKFVFKAPKIAELKQRSIIGCSTFIWKHFIDVDQVKEGVVASAARVYMGSHTVNMRTRIVPPLPTNSIGNMYCAAIALSIINGNPENDQDKEDHQYSNLVGKVRDAIRKIDSDHVRELQTIDALLNSMKPMEEGVSSGQT
ncbi:Transferase [Macleaya cordata]|uniref:Transferase n=1 Tax=Macleaya cordata TaxID=56857 RepID=A0A200PTF5_MACCD|nr:Transferase [Macleaya cordata]